MSTTQMIVIALAVIIVLYFLLRSGSGGKATTTPARLKVGMVHLVPGAEGCCEAAKRQTSARYKAASAPNLPLPECNMPNKCKCSMQSMGNRRSGVDRRSGDDKRDSIRFEDKMPRRKSRGRRPGDHDVFKDEDD